LQGVTCLLEHYASPQEISKYHQFLEEIEQITKLTVGLTIRLGRLVRKIETGTKTREEMVIDVRIRMICNLIYVLRNSK
jgi:hypothetical protein